MHDSAPIDAGKSGGMEKEEEETKNELFERVLEVRMRVICLIKFIQTAAQNYKDSFW